MSKLTSAEQAELRFLRGQVDNLEAELFSRDMHRDVHADLLRARRELKKFVQGLRDKGREI